MSESVTDFNRSPNAYASSRGLRTGLRRRVRPGVRLSIGTASTGPFPRLERLGPRESRRTYGSSTTKRNLPNQRLVLPAPIPIRKHFWSSTHSPLPWNAIAMRPTKKNLKRHAAKPLTRWLIRAANDRSFVTYGQAKRRLETEAGFTTIFSAHMGVPAGELMYRIQDIMPDCPLLNVLLVQQGDKMPSEGAGPFMADYLADPRLADPEFRSQDPQTRRRASCSNSGTGTDSPNCCLPGCFANTLYPPRGGPTFESP